ncbi:pentatricopeptide repeat-containing protein At5g39710 [Medicago truncatula]|uniref:pentatricopeptide repeat-containing protein At5g39710 n=1 Tax=Medicago truncatula TaxID=3880 RepID=UPI000D2F40EC|nr:pentatricopeptide repeat-containing protein At5g39710 [Medicago truncatula]
MNSMCRLWFVENAVSCLSLFVKSGLEIDTVSVTTHIKGFAINNPSEGFQFANYLSMKNIPDTMNEITVGTLIIVIVWISAKETSIMPFFEKELIIEPKEVISSCVTQLDITSLGSIINSFSKNGMIEVSLALIPVMLKQGFNQNLIILNSLMADFSLIRQSDKCIKLLGLLGSTANLISYTILVDSLMNESKVQEAMSFFHQMRANGISLDQFILTSVINGYVNTGRSKLALFLIDKHQETLLKETTVLTYTVMIRAHLRAKQLDKAHKLLTEMQFKGLKLSSITYHVIIDELFRLECFNEAKTAFYHAIYNQLNVSVLAFNAS